MLVNDRNLGTHSLEISGICCHSDFTWNQSWRIYSLKICHFNKLRLKFIKYPKLRALQMAKNAFLELPDSPKLISRKIWMLEKSWNFHTVMHLRSTRCIFVRYECRWNGRYFGRWLIAFSLSLLKHSKVIMLPTE